MADLRIGLTGGIGSGKSTVAAIWVSLGATLIDTDAIAHALTGPGGAAMPDLRREFGDDIEQQPEGGLHRARMRALAFSQPPARQRLEALLHPLIGAEAQRQAEATTGAVVFDVPLLTESRHWRARCQRIAVVDCSEPTQVERVVARAGWHEQQVRQIIGQQASRSARRAIADAVIHNDGLSLDQLQQHATQLWRRWTAVLS
ncbi:dephospho-CoA kinase [Aquincola sp. S2]|uniref:Dephospho-CoA kinase n=1 Tax=Pseudaquabacterium terrae TaxID=2732868 RepID=A0ABX2ET35_9BURK|nr:dephospho-CoA kinase [Aquabacterium terrae]NRF71910.1 dephospho-CoA kinase [Aquabacterium terrae]